MLHNLINDWLHDDRDEILSQDGESGYESDAEAFRTDFLSPPELHARPSSMCLAWDAQWEGLRISARSTREWKPISVAQPSLQTSR